MKTIKLKLSSQSIQDCIKEVNQYKDKVISNTDKLREFFADRLRSRIQSYFNTASISELIDGSSEKASVNVTIDNNGNTTVVVANGSDAVWAEFGTGIYFNGSVGSSPHPKGQELGLTIGSYGKGKGKYPQWTYKDKSGKGVTTHGAPASMPMYNSFIQLRQNIISIAKEVFK